MTGFSYLLLLARCLTALYLSDVPSRFLAFALSFPIYLVVAEPETFFHDGGNFHLRFPPALAPFFLLVSRFVIPLPTSLVALLPFIY